MNHHKIDAIVCVGNPRPILLTCITQILKQTNLSRVVVVYKHWGETLTELTWTPRVLLVGEWGRVDCLAHARRFGVDFCTSEYVIYVDQDVILHKNHFTQLQKKAEILRAKYDHFAVEGILTKKAFGKYAPIPRKYPERILKDGERGFTHNTLLRRKTLLLWYPQWGMAWEDWQLTCHVHKLGGIWVRTKINPIKSYHIGDYNSRSRSAWSSAGRRLLQKTYTRKTLLRNTCFNLLYGLKWVVITRDCRDLIEQLLVSLGMWMGFQQWDKHLGCPRRVSS